MPTIIHIIGDEEPVIFADHIIYKYEKFYQVLTLTCPQNKYEIEWDKGEEFSYEYITKIGCITDKITLDFAEKSIEFIYNPSTDWNSVKTQCTSFKP